MVTEEQGSGFCKRVETVFRSEGERETDSDKQRDRTEGETERKEAGGETWTDGKRMSTSEMQRQRERIQDKGVRERDRLGDRERRGRIRGKETSR